MAPNGRANASLAGVCAAFAGICAKFARSPDSPQVLVRTFSYMFDHYIPSSYVTYTIFEFEVNCVNTFLTYIFLKHTWIIRGVFALATLTFNSLMLTLTAKALQLCPTTVQSVVTTSAVNFLFTV